MQKISSNWPKFCELRVQHLSQAERFGAAPEKIAEEIIRDLFTLVLDWSVDSFNYQLKHSDIVLTSPGIKWIVIEAKRPGLLTYKPSRIEMAFNQVLRYAAEQKIRCAAICDGNVLFAKDVQAGGTKDRVFVDLRSNTPPNELWWLSLHGIYRPCDEPQENSDFTSSRSADGISHDLELDLTHPKYKIPARCFAYVGNFSDVKTWKLPYLHFDGSVDLKRLPLAISSILKTYRGERVKTIPEPAMPEVLIRLAKAANKIGKLPVRLPDNPVTNYELLYLAIYQQEKLEEVFLA